MEPNGTNEIWVDIKGYEGLYQISTKGNVKSLERLVSTKGGALRKVSEKLRENTFDKDGYHRIALHKEGKRSMKFVHRLVAIGFIENPDNLPQVNHKDGVKSNNCVDNLEWVTEKENAIHSYDILGNKAANRESNGSAKLTEEAVQDIRSNYIKYKTPSKLFADKYGVSGSTICYVARGDTW